MAHRGIWKGEGPLLEQQAPGVHHTDVPVGWALAAAHLLISDHLAWAEEDEDRREKKHRVVRRLRSEFAGLTGGADPWGSMAAWLTAAPPDERSACLVEISFLEPFTPYSLKSKKTDRKAARGAFEAAFMLEPGTFEHIGDVRTAATRAHTRRNLQLAIGVGVGVAVVGGVTGFLAAPLLGAALGGAAGLAGAAATGHGLALLGGGALAAGGGGMVGGMWLVAGAGAAAGAVAGGGGMQVYQLGSARAQEELIKLQVTFKIGLLERHADTRKAQEVIVRLQEDLEGAKAQLADERLLNEDNARRVKDLEATVEAIEQALGWMEAEEASA